MSSSPAQATAQCAGACGSIERNSSTTIGPVTSSSSISTRGLIRRATATHSAFIRLIMATSEA